MFCENIPPKDTTPHDFRSNSDNPSKLQGHRHRSLLIPRIALLPASLQLGDEDKKIEGASKMRVVNPIDLEHLLLSSITQGTASPHRSNQYLETS